jgi:Putative F0F1-ATPase subunit Ca2+/Mg2+ transporter
VFDLAARRQLNRGYNDSLSRAVEIVATPLLFGWVGYLIDGWIGIRPVLTLVLATVGVAGIFVKMWLGYDRQMREHEARAVWAKPGPATGDGPPGEGAAS